MSSIHSELMNVGGPQFIPGVNFDNNLLTMLREKYPHLSVSNIVGIMHEVMYKLPVKRVEILKDYLPGYSLNFSGDGIFNCGFYYQLYNPRTFDKRIGDLLCERHLPFVLQRDWYYSSEFLHKGFWITSDCFFYGVGIITLVAFVLGCPYVDAFIIIAKKLGNKKCSSQINHVEGYRMMLNPIAYPLSPIDPAANNILGQPSKIIHFRDLYGQTYYWMGIWFINGERISLYRTVQLNASTNQIEQTYIAPKLEDKCMYNQDQMYSSPEKDVHFHDDILRADSSNSDTSIGSWIEDSYQFSPDERSMLKNRKISFVYAATNRDSILLGFHLISEIKSLGVHLTLHPISFPDHTNGCYLPPETSYEEFCNSAQDHSIPIPSMGNQENEDSLIKPISDLSLKDSAEPELIPGLLRLDEDACLVAKCKLGKTRVASIMGAVVGSGQSIGKRLVGSMPFDVLFIDSEMGSEAIASLFKSFECNFEEPNQWINRIHYLDINKLKEDFDLSLPENQELLRSKISKIGIKFGLIIFDNYDGFIPPDMGKSESVCRSIERFRKSLDCAKLTVMHENKGGDVRGSGKIIDSCTLCMRLTKTEDCPVEKTRVTVNIENPRFLYGENKRPFTLEFETIGDETRIHEIGDEVAQETLVSQDEIDKDDLDNRDVVILQKARTSGQPISAKMFVQEGVLGYSSSSVFGSLNKLTKAKRLIKHGKGKGTTYTAVNSDTDASIG